MRAKGLAALALALATGLAGCGQIAAASRGATLNGAPGAPNRAETAAPVLPAIILVEPIYDVRGVTVTVPRELRVSEADRYYPLADIVWRGEPKGDRHAQVQAIFEAAMARGSAGMREGPGVTVEIGVRRFHALSEKARFRTGGVHSIRFDYTLRDAATGEVMDGPRQIVADLPASGGAKALEEDVRGLTQKVRITAHLATLIRRELTTPLPETADEPGS